MKICIDPGHGGQYLGAIGPAGTNEKDINLAIGLALHDILIEHGHGVVLTRADDTNPLYTLGGSKISRKLRKRVEIAHDFHADLFISLHCNAAGNPRVQGIEVYTTKGQTDADHWAKKIQGALLMRFPDHRDFADPGPSEDNLYVLTNTRMPAVLIEAEFITHPKQEAFLLSHGRAIAEAIGGAIK